jgi:hypothetical protein
LKIAPRTPPDRRRYSSENSASAIRRRSPIAGRFATSARSRRSPRRQTSANAGTGATSARHRPGVERLAQRAAIPQDLTRRGTRVRSPFPGTPKPLAVTPRGHLRPDEVTRERPPLTQGPGLPPGGGSSRPKITLISHPRGFGGGQDRRLDPRHGVFDTFVLQRLVTARCRWSCSWHAAASTCRARR